MIIQSILDTDLYKLTMQQAVIALFPNEVARYQLFIRSKRNFPRGFSDQLKKEIKAMGELHLQTLEAQYIQQTCYFLKPPYIDFLKGYHYNPEEVSVLQEQDTLQLFIEGYWYRTILWEVPLMALISELFFRMTGQIVLPPTEIKDRIRAKAAKFENIGAAFMDFGTRRRYSSENQELVVKICQKNAPTKFIGTSNPMMAMKYNCRVLGTQAHEWYMAIAAIHGFGFANNIGMEKWVDVYQGDLGIALTDTFTSDAFFLAFTTKYAKLFDGIRQDSGDPIKFVKKSIAHYKKLRIDPMSKTIVFSDSLNVDTITRIHQFCRGKINDSYGIGTNLSNDVGVEPLNIVIKLTGIKQGNEWVPTVKLSDDRGKHTGNSEMVELCKRIFRTTGR